MDVATRYNGGATIDLPPPPPPARRYSFLLILSHPAGLLTLLDVSHKKFFYCYGDGYWHGYWSLYPTVNFFHRNIVNMCGTYCINIRAIGSSLLPL